MSYQLPPAASFETLLDYAAGVHAALLALDPAGPLAAPWLGHRTALKAAQDARDADRFSVRCAGKVVDVWDAQWDKAIGELSGIAFLAAGKKAAAEPYASLFGTTKAAQARALGYEVAATFAEGLLQKAAVQNHPMLATALHDLAHVNPALHQAGQARTTAEQKAATHEVVRKQWLAQTEALIATTEAALLGKWPGRSDLVRAVLAPDAAGSGAVK